MQPQVALLLHQCLGHPGKFAKEVPVLNLDQGPLKPPPWVQGRSTLRLKPRLQLQETVLLPDPLPPRTDLPTSLFFYALHPNGNTSMFPSLRSQWIRNRYRSVLVLLSEKYQGRATSIVIIIYLAIKALKTFVHVDSPTGFNRLDRA